jgi:hypothetical protein
MDVVEACADSLLAASALALILQADLLKPTDQISVEQARTLAIRAIDRIIERTYTEGAKPR